MPAGAQTYIRSFDPSSPERWPCDGTDPGHMDMDSPGQMKMKCYRASPASASPMTPSPPSTFSSLDETYTKQVAEYDAVMKASIQEKDPSKLTELRTKSEQIQATLNKMIENLTYLKKETPDIRAERDALLEKLRRIQRDYSEMIVNTDDLETLRRIREEEGGEAKRQLFLYLIAFLFMSVMLMVYLMFVGRMKDTSATTVPTPTMSPALT
jgi:septal ring factor EnvC (AmiA/AmiB activator)